MPFAIRSIRQPGYLIQRWFKEGFLLKLHHAETVCIDQGHSVWVTSPHLYWDPHGLHLSLNSKQCGTLEHLWARIEVEAMKARVKLMSAKALRWRSLWHGGHQWAAGVEREPGIRNPRFLSQSCHLLAAWPVTDHWRSFSTSQRG